MAKAPVKAPTAPVANPAKPTPPKGNTVATNKPSAKSETTAPTQTPKYPDVKIEIFRGENAITADKAKELLGWETEADYLAKMKTADPNLNEDAVKFGSDFFLEDRLGNKVRLKNNTKNRPWSQGVSEAYMQDILKKHWALNGETIIIGKYGRILSGQHRLIALVFAEQERTKDESATAHWGEFWDGPCVLECVVAYGIEESAHVTRTLDNVKSRTLSDVIFADTDTFGNLKSAAERKTASRMLDYAVRFLWSRAGENKDSWAPKRTHAESLDFVDRHPRLKECIKHILEEEKDGRISKVLYPGHAAALLYLMGHSSTPQDDIEDYMVKRPTDEKGLKWGNFKKAKMFWSDIAREAPEMKNLRLARRPLPNDTDGFSGFVFAETDDGGGSFDERVGMLVRAWESYKADAPIEGLELTYESKPDSTTGAIVYELKEFPTIQGSIDVGKTIKVKKTKEPKPGDGDEASELDSLSEDGEAGEETGDGETPPKQPAKPQAKDAAKAEWEELKKTYGDNHILFYRSKNNSGNHMVYFDDAEKLGEAIGSSPKMHPATGVLQIVIGEKELEECAIKAKEAGFNSLVLNFENGKWNAKPYQTADESFEQPDSSDADTPPEGEGEVSETEEETEEEEPQPVPQTSAKKVTIKRKP